MTIHFTSDLHIGHAGILKHRTEFTDLDAMHHRLALEWDMAVGDRDTVFILGDAAMGIRTETLPWFHDRPGHKVLVPGNHDDVHPMHTKISDAKAAAYYRAFDHIAGPNLLVTLFGTEDSRIIMPWDEPSVPFTGPEYRNVHLSHFPAADAGGREHDVRDYSAWGPDFSRDTHPDRSVGDYPGHPVVHGHVHDAWRTHKSPSGVAHVNVGVDVWDWAPVSANTLLDAIREAERI